MIATDTGPVDVGAVLTPQGDVNVAAVLTPPDGPGEVAAVLNGPPVADVIIIPPPPTPVDGDELDRRQTNDIG